MEIYEITGFQTGQSQEGVNFLQPSDSFDEITNGFIHRQVLQSRLGSSLFPTGQLTNGTRVTGIFEFYKRDNTTELLVTDQSHLYKYNNGTNAFDQISYGGAASAFSLSDNSFYISGTTYPRGDDGSDRFVFTGRGVGDIYQYDGSTVTSFTDSGDNTGYVAPSGGALTEAWHVVWYNERLNLLNPKIAGLDNPQTVLYTGIRDSDNNGEKFVTSGAGELIPDTNETIQSVSVVGNIMILHFTRSSFVVEKSSSAFNPYTIRKIPSPLGTDAPFSHAEWSNTVRTLGLNGLISTDGREINRVDNKIPFYTRDEIDSLYMDLVYGGFDRDNGQFLFSYKSNDTELVTQDKILVNNYEENTWSTYNLRVSCFGQTNEGQNLTWDDIDEDENPSWLEWDTTEELWGKIGLGATVQKTLAGDDNGFVYWLNQDYDDHTLAITAITQATQAVLTIGAHPFVVGDEVVVSSVSGMTEINNYDESADPTEFTSYFVEATSATTITLSVDSSTFTAYTSGGIVSMPISFRAKLKPFNPFREIGRKCYVSHVEFLLENNGSFLRVDMIEDDYDSAFKENVLVATTSSKEREWVSVVVNQEMNFFNMVLRQKSASAQVKLYSIRIHAKPGGITSG